MRSASSSIASVLRPSLALVAAAAVTTACSSTPGASGAGAGGAGHAGPPGGPVAGPADAHCGAKVQPTSAAACHMPPGAGGGTAGTGGGMAGMGAGGHSMHGMSGMGGMVMSYGPTLPNAEGDDDDCKYHVKWTSTDVYEDTDVTFTVVGTRKEDGAPLAGADPIAEVYLDDTHPAPSTAAKATEGPPGTYSISPIRFDAPGRWTVRFHFHPECSDMTPDSPHGHAAFYVQVP
jgi:hypothetical protein